LNGFAEVLILKIIKVGARPFWRVGSRQSPFCFYVVLCGVNPKIFPF